MPRLTQAERTANDIPLSQLVSAMASARKDIQTKIRKAIKNGKTDLKYWEERLKEISLVYNEILRIEQNYLTKQIPFQFNKASDIVKLFMESKGFRRQTIRNLFVVNALQAIIQNTMTYYRRAARAGEAEVRQLFILTQQRLVSEKAINQALSSGLIAENTVQAAARKVEATLYEKLAEDGRVMTTNLETGKTRSFTPDYYAELTARTRTREAQSLGTVNTVLEFGQDLVKVSDHNTLTPECKVHENKIYSITGTTPGYEKYTKENQVGYHPNCWHVITPYISREDLQEAV